MGARGPAPKREGARRRRNLYAEDGSSVEVTRLEVTEGALSAIEADALAPSDDWHEIATELYESLFRSGTKIFMEPSDWAMAYMLCDQISRHLTPQVVTGPEGAILDDNGEILMRVVPMNGSTLAALIKGLGQLGVTEAERRRMKIELERGEAGSSPAAGAGATVTSIRKDRLSS